MFLTDKAAKEKIAGLESRITELEADAVARDQALTDAQTDLATANETIATQSHELAGVKGLLEAATATIETQAATIAANPTEAQITERVEAATLAKFQGLGGTSVQETTGDAGEAKSFTRAEFQALTPAARQAHIQARGKLTD